MLSRVDKGLWSTWWWTIDRWFLAAFLSLMGLGVVLAFAASPAVADRIGVDTFHFVYRQAGYMVIALGVMLGVSLLSPRHVRRMALIVLAGSIVLMIAVLIFGAEVKGAKRWLSFGSVSVQPSEFMKPAFIIICAWLFAEKAKKTFPGDIAAMALLGGIVGLLILQPDMGQTILTLGAWGVMFFLAGMSWIWIAVLGVLGVVGAVSAYAAFDHVRERVNGFLHGEGDLYQVNLSRDAVINGGWFGVGPGEGVMKRSLPDSHADFVFAVAGEEFGIVMCMIIMSLFAFIVLRGLLFALRERDDFTRYAIAGLVTIFGLQSIINMGVNLQLLPAKGMTLPFVSYGGSSLIAIAMSMGMVLALSRKSPERLKSRRLSMPPAAMVPAE